MDQSSTSTSTNYLLHTPIQHFPFPKSEENIKALISWERRLAREWVSVETTASVDFAEIVAIIIRESNKFLLINPTTYYQKESISLSNLSEPSSIYYHINVMTGLLWTSEFCLLKSFLGRLEKQRALFGTWGIQRQSTDGPRLFVPICLGGCYGKRPTCSLSQWTLFSHCVLLIVTMYMESKRSLWIYSTSTRRPLPDQTAVLWCSHIQLPSPFAQRERSSWHTTIQAKDLFTKQSIRESQKCPSFDCSTLSQMVIISAPVML